MSTLQEKLEDFKQLGNYAVSLFYGEDIGCDDMDVPAGERAVKVMGSPVGCVGEARLLFVGSLTDFLNANLKQKPVQLSNPPRREDWKNGGYFIFGTEDGVQSILEKPFFEKWED